MDGKQQESGPPTTFRVWQLRAASLSSGFPRRLDYFTCSRVFACHVNSLPSHKICSNFPNFPRILLKKPHVNRSVWVRFDFFQKRCGSSRVLATTTPCHCCAWHLYAT
jgi:hypothetical protein